MAPVLQRGIARRWKAILAGIVVLALLAAAAWQYREQPVTARPALWRLSLGDRHAWLFGTIHAVPTGARWLSPAIASAAQESDGLVLEAAGLEAERRDARVFETLGRSAGLPPVASRLNPADRPRLAALVKASPTVLRDLDGYESWAAALLIGAAANGQGGASSEDAPEARLEKLFRANGHSTTGLETISEQLGLFDALPQGDQDALLAQAVTEAADAPRQFGQLYARWAAGDLGAIEAQFLRPLDQSPRLRNALVDQRNALWARRIDKLLRENGRTYFIAVGTGHLIGPKNVISSLTQRGWKVERVQ